MALKILLADDSMTAQNMGKKILSGAGYEVTAVSNGAAAVKKLAEVRPDIVVLDVYMPGYSGLEVCEQVKQTPATAHTPVLLTVGKLEPFRPEEGMKAKADGLIIKPFEATDLIAVVGKLAERVEAPQVGSASLHESGPPATTQVSSASLREPFAAIRAGSGPSEPAAPLEFSIEPALLEEYTEPGPAVLPDTSPVQAAPEPGLRAESSSPTLSLQNEEQQGRATPATEVSPEPPAFEVELVPAAPEPELGVELAKAIDEMASNPTVSLENPRPQEPGTESAEGPAAVEAPAAESAGPASIPPEPEEPNVPPIEINFELEPTSGGANAAPETANVLNVALPDLEPTIAPPAQEAPVEPEAGLITSAAEWLEPPVSAHAETSLPPVDEPPECALFGAGQGTAAEQQFEARLDAAIEAHQIAAEIPESRPPAPPPEASEDKAIGARLPWYVEAAAVAEAPATAVAEAVAEPEVEPQAIATEEPLPSEIAVEPASAEAEIAEQLVARVLERLRPALVEEVARWLRERQE